MRAFAVILSAALLVSGCGGAIERPERTDRTHLVRVNDDEVRALDPHKVSVVSDVRVVSDLFQGLTDLDPAGRPIPGQAEAWSVTADGLIWTFRLRSGLAWSDATAITADDFVYSFRRLVDPATAGVYANLINAWVGAQAILRGEAAPETLGVTALNARTLEIRLRHPEPALPEMLAYGSLAPVPRHVIEAHGDAWSRPETIVSNGAFMLKSWQRQAAMELVKNPRFHAADSVALERLTYIPISDDMTAVRRFRAGEVDIIPDFPNPMADLLKEQLGSQVHLTPYQATFYWVFNTQKAPFDNADVRRALSMAVDREAIIASIMRIGNRPAYAMVPPQTGTYGAAYRPDWADWTLADRRAEAARLLAQAGYGPDAPLKATFRYNTSDTYRRIALAVAQMWQPLGVELSLFNAETAVHFSALRSGDYDIGRSGWVADYNAPENFLFVFMEASKGLNYAAYANPRYDALLSAAQTQPSAAKRMALMREAEALLMDDSPLLPFYFYISKALVAGDITGWQDNPTGKHRSRWLAFAP